MSKFSVGDNVTDDRSDELITVRAFNMFGCPIVEDGSGAVWVSFDGILTKVKTREERILEAIEDYEAKLNDMGIYSITELKVSDKAILFAILDAGIE